MSAEWNTLEDEMDSQVDGLYGKSLRKKLKSGEIIGYFAFTWEDENASCLNGYSCELYTIQYLEDDEDDKSSTPIIYLESAYTTSCELGCNVKNRKVYTKNLWEAEQSYILKKFKIELPDFPTDDEIETMMKKNGVDKYIDNDDLLAKIKYINDK